MPKVIAVIPVFNEARTLPDILPRVAAGVDILICVNDGSRDRSRALLESFATGRKGVYLVDLPSNQGMAGALKQGFLFVLFLRSLKVIADGDVVATIDADGQHKPEYIPRIVRYLVRKGADVVLTRRDFSVYPRYKIMGNWFLTKTNSVLSGMKYHDVESGLRLLKVKTLEPILRYYTGVQYSCAQEIALVSARSGFKIDNDFQVDIAYYRPGTTVWDGFIVLALSLLAYARWVLKISAKTSFDGTLMEKSLMRSRRLWKKTRIKTWMKNG